MKIPHYHLKKEENMYYLVKDKQNKSAVFLTESLDDSEFIGKFVYSISFYKNTISFYTFPGKTLPLTYWFRQAITQNCSQVVWKY